MSDHKSRARTINNGIVKLWKITWRRLRANAPRELRCNAIENFFFSFTSLVTVSVGSRMEFVPQIVSRAINREQKNEHSLVYDWQVSVEFIVLQILFHSPHDPFDPKKVYYQFNAPFINDSKTFPISSWRLLKPVNFTSTLIAETFSFCNNFWFIFDHLFCRRGKKNKLNGWIDFNYGGISREGKQGSLISLQLVLTLTWPAKIKKKFLCFIL